MQTRIRHRGIETSRAAGYPRVPLLPTPLTRVVASAEIFKSTNPQAVAVLPNQLESVTFASRQTVFAEGDSGDRLYVIASGMVKMCCLTSEGRDHLLAVLGPSDMFGELSVFDPGPRMSTATALTAVTAVALDRAAFRGWMAERPEVAERLLQALARRARRGDDELADLALPDAAGRVARQLLEMAHRFGVRDGETIHVTHHLTQEEIAQLVGSTRETVNKILVDFSRRRWIRADRKSVIIIDGPRLARRAGLRTDQHAGTATASNRAWWSHDAFIAVRQ